MGINSPKGNEIGRRIAAGLGENLQTNAKLVG
jgi:hypothetical protein